MNRREDEARSVKAGANAVLSEIAGILGAGMQRLIHRPRQRADMSNAQTCDQRSPGIGVRERTRQEGPHAP